MNIRRRNSLAPALTLGLVTLGVVYAQPPADKLINYSTDKKSVQYIVIDPAKQAGLGYDWNKSFAQTDPECRRFVNDVSIESQPFNAAMA